jgi:hypothetical protein
MSLVRMTAWVVAAAIVGCGGAPATMESSAKAKPVEPAAVKPAPAPAPAPKQETPKDPNLVGHWTFDEGKDMAAADASGHNNHGKLVGSPKWVAGKLGGALEFDGKESYVEIPRSPELENLQEGNYSIAAWFKAADAPPGQEADNNANYGIVVKTGWHEGLHYSNEKKFIFEHWLAGEKPEEPKWVGAGTWDDSYEPGAWVHLVGVVERTAGTVSIYVNGELKNTGEAWDANSKAREYGEMPWRIGIAAPGSQKWGWSAKGAIDDVRLYRKALAEADVQALYKAASK